MSVSTWILLRGLTRGSGHWGRFPEILQRRLGGSMSLTLDLPGNGTLHRLRSPAQIAKLTDACRQTLHAPGSPPPYFLFAVSMGALVAIDWAAREPGALAGCVLVNTSLRGFSPWHWRLRPASYPKLLRIVSSRPELACEQEILRLTSRNEAVSASVVDDWAALRALQPVSRSNAFRQLVAAASFSPPLQAPSIPVLILSSRGDALVDPRCSEALARRWHCASAVHPWAGHDLTLDDGEWVAEQVCDWLGKGRGTNAGSEN